MDTDVIKNDSKTAFEYAFVEENEEKLEAFKDINADIKYQKLKSGFKSRSGRQIKLPLKYRTSVGNKNKSNYSKMSAVSYDSLINIAEDVESIVCDVKGPGTNEPHADCPSVQEPFATGKSGLKRDSQECPKCHKQFINAKREYHNHCKHCPSDSKNIPARKEYTCTKCDSKFKYQLSYKKHIQNCTSTESTDTPLNNDSPTTLYVRKKPKFKKYGCDLCSYSSYKRRGLSNHKFNKHAIPYPEHYEIYSCQHSGCDFITAEKTRISTHMKKHSNDKEYACEVCGSRFKHASSLVTHQLIHSDQRPYTCSWDDCTGAFRTKGALENHYKSVHLNERPKRFLCTECGKSYRTRREWNYHMYKHHAQPLPDSYKRYFCELCDYWTEVKRNYEVHLLRHRGDKPEMCEICGKCFVDVSSKNGHKKFHAVDKKFKCTYSDCNFKCIKKKAFLEHLSLMHINKGEKKFQCHLCNYRGAMKGNFTKHLRTVHKLQVITKQKLSQPKLNRETEDLNSAVVITKDGTAVSLSNHDNSETTHMMKDVTEASSDENAYIETIMEPEDISSQNEQGYQETVIKESDSESERNDSQVGLSFINQDGTVYRSYRISELKELLLLDKEGASDILDATNMENTLVDVHVEGQSNLQSALCIGEDLE
ncbi:unnamed protein product [Owenia fusiformis]|uniref:C2H2-type domain-containing protein n=1 Tax=Owenia fusiformis TaxID=6347 RepID=A0A8J1YCC1_OWEFU|nr:unnamed protein product [Owenia fusiformis]CAH1790291.1 unnamed protein product [Owenia fusiformis]